MSTSGALPIQTPVSPNGKYVITANTLSGTITVISTATDALVNVLPCSAGCHGVNFGAKKGGGYYAYVSSKFSNDLIVLDPDPNDDGNPSDAQIVGRIILSTAGNDAGVQADDQVTAYAGMGHTTRSRGLSGLRLRRGGSSPTDLRKQQKSLRLPFHPRD